MLGEVFNWEGGEILAQVAREVVDASIPEGVQDQIGQDSEQPDPVLDLVVVNPAHVWDKRIFEVSKPFYDSTILWFWQHGRKHFENHSKLI